MELKKMQIKMLSCCFLAGGLTLAGCSTDDSIDVGDVDTTIGVKLNNFTVPLGKTDDISIDDVLELDEGDCIKIKANGDYEFSQEGDDVAPAKPKVDIINVSKQTSIDYNPNIGPSEKPEGFDLMPLNFEIPGSGGTFTKDINTFNYSADKPDDVVSLSKAEVEGQVTLTLSFSWDLQQYLSNFTSMSIEFPAYMKLANPTKGTMDGNTLKLGNIPTNTTLSTTLDIKELKFQNVNDDNKLVIENGKITMLGSVKVVVTYPNLKKKGDGDITNLVINSTTSISTVQIKSATGKFDPEIDLDDVGDIEVTGVPDFLNDPDVNIILKDPQITLTIGSNVDLDANIAGTLTSYIDNVPKAVVNTPTIKIPRNKTSKILICRQPKTEPYQDYTAVYAIPNLSDLIKNIPDKITFKANASADKNAEGTINLGKEYEISTAYNFKADLSLEAGSTIVYDDKTDGFYEDIDDNDIDLRGQTDLVITGKVTNKTPLDLDLIPTAIDVNGNPLPSIKLTSANTLKSNLDGSAPSELKITLSKPANVNLKDVKFDGIKFKAKAVSASDVTLNKDKHSIKIEDLKLNINSEVSIDADSKKDK